jgi:DNA-binding HxlR family transcriptional regulator
MNPLRCPFTAAISLIGGRWKSIILYILSGHTRRFGEISSRMPSISGKVLSQQLKELEADGLIHRKEYKQIPPRVDYSLTELGQSLTPILKDLEIWGRKNVLSTMKTQDLTGK